MVFSSLNHCGLYRIFVSCLFSRGSRGFRHYIVTKYSTTIARLSSRIGNEYSARNFSDRSFLEPPWGHGRLRLWVKDVRTEKLVSPGFRGPDRSFCPRTSAGIAALTSAGPRTHSLGCFFVPDLSGSRRRRRSSDPTL